MNNNIFAAFVYGAGTATLLGFTFDATGFLFFVNLFGVACFVAWLVITLISDYKANK